MILQTNANTHRKRPPQAAAAAAAAGTTTGTQLQLQLQLQQLKHQQSNGTTDKANKGTTWMNCIATAKQIN